MSNNKQPRTVTCHAQDIDAVMTLDEWNDDDGDVLWWKFPVSEPPYVGSPLSDDFPDYVTHWTRIRVPKLGTAEPSSEQSARTAVTEAPLPEALRGCADFARGFVEGARSATAPTPEQDRAIIRRALDVVEAWDTRGGVGAPPFYAAFESLRSALAAAGYLDAKGGSNG